MVRETRHLWVGNLPDSIREDRIRDHFKRYGRVQSVKLLGRKEDEGGGLCATVSFMDIKSAAKAHHSEQKLEDRLLTTEYHEPPSIPSTNSIHYSSRYASNEEVVGFERAPHFYEGGGREGRDYLSRRYHAEPAIPRPRRQDARIYRNGPYSALISPTSERSRSDHHSRSWGYESPRYSTSSVPAPQDISYPEERRESSSLHSSKKHSKSRSGSDSASSASSRSSSPSSRSSSCSSATSSPASEKSCSAHSQHGSLRGNAGSVNASSINSSSPAVHSEDRRPLAICVRNLPARSSDTSLKDGLYHEYKKHGKVTWVKVVGQGSERYAVVCFKKTEDVDKALQVSHDKLFFGCKIDVAPYQGYDVDDNEFSFVCRPFEADQDEFHPKATRTLFIGNLEKDITMQEIRKHFDQFGEILDIDIKKQGTTSSYAFCQYTDIASVVRAIRSLDGEHLGSTRVKLGFGKSLQTNCVWVDGIAESVSEKYLSQHFSQFGPVSHVLIDRTRGQALISFEQITYAQQAVKEMRGVMLRGRKLQIDYASRECQDSFYDHIDKQTTPHTNYETTVTTAVTNNSAVRGFETPSSSSSSCGGGSASGRYVPSSRSYPPAGQPGSRYHSSPSQQRTTRQRYAEYPSDYPQDRRTSYRSYEDIISVEDGEGRHKERMDIEECQSSGEEGVSRRKCKHRRSDGDSSRPGTPLCDERPEPTEPRRPRERTQDPLSLPLPRFATQVLPPPSPPSSDDSQPSPPSPEWEERLRSLDEKYRKWSGSRTNPTRPDPTSVRLRHRLLALDPHDLQPSDIVKSLLAKRSVFDEDLKRLENFGEKYEPKEFVPGRVLRSPGSPVQGKGLQYPFPSHPADPSRPPTSTMNTPTTPTAPTTSNNPPSFTKPQPQPQQQLTVPIKPKTEKTEIKKDITSSLLVSSIKPKPFRRDSEPSETRRKSREEAPEITKSLESVVKKEDTSECDKVKDAQVCERRKSTTDKRRNSIDSSINSKDLSIDTLDKVKENFDKKESRRASCDSVDSDSKLKDPRKHIHESVELIMNLDPEKSKKLDSDFRKETELSSKNSGNIDIDRKKDIFGVNSEKDRRRKENIDTLSDNPKHKKVPETNKCDSLAVKPDSDETKMTDIDKKKEDSGKLKKEQICSERERRRDSIDSDTKKPPKLDEYPKQKDIKLSNDIKTIRKDSELDFPNLTNKKENEKETVRNKDGDKKKNCETEISKEHSLFKKVFGFTDGLRNKDNKKDMNFLKNDLIDKSKEKKDILNDSKSKKDLEIDNIKHKFTNRKSPENQDSSKHKDIEKKKNTDIPERKKKDHDVNNDDYLPKDYDVNYHNKRKVIERCLTKDGLNINNDNDIITKFSKDQERKKDYLYEDLKRNDDFDSGDNKKEENKLDVFSKDHKKKEYSHTDMISKNDKKSALDSNYDSEKYFDNERKKDDHIERFKENKSELNNDNIKLKHFDKHERKRHQDFVENSKIKDEKKKEDPHERHKKKDNDFENIKLKEDPIKTNDKRKDNFENNKFRDMDDAIRKRKDLESMEQTKPKETSERKKDILEKERRRDRELVDAKYKDDEKRREPEKEKKRKDVESHEKMNGDHTDSIFDTIEEHDQKDTSKRDKKKEHKINSWPASIGCKRRLSSQDSDLAEESKRSKQERRDSKDSGKSSGSSKKGEKHSKSFSRSLDERLKEDKEHDKKKDDFDSGINEEKHKKQFKKEKKNEKKKEEKKFKSRLKENGTASESDLNSGDEEVKNMKRQHSIFDIVDDEPAYISMYDKVKARSTKNMQKQEEEKRQEKLKEKFNQLKQSRAKREEKKRSTSYDEDSDSERGGGGHNRRSNKLMITSSEEDNASECDFKMSKNKKITFDFSEDDSMLVTPKSKLIRSHNQDQESKTRKILSDTSEDEYLCTLKPQVSTLIDIKLRTIMSDTSEDDELKSLSRSKPSRIQSDESENKLNSYSIVKEVETNQHLINSVTEDVYSKRDFSCHNNIKNSELVTNIRLSSPEEFRRNSLEELPRKKKKQKKQKNFDDGDGSSSKKHSSKKDKKKSHSKDDDENCKKSKKKKDRDSNKREEKMEDIFGTLSEDSDKALMWQSNQIYRTDSDSDHETIRKKEKRRREKKARELDEAGRALEANLMDPNESYHVVEPVKNKKKKRKKSRDEKIKHHHSDISLDQRIEEERHSFLDGYVDYKSQQKIRCSLEKEMKMRSKEDTSYDGITKENRYNEESQQRIEEEAIESILPPTIDNEDVSSNIRPQSMATLLDSPPHVQLPHQTKKIEIPGFRGIGVDDDIHESAVKSISETSNNSIQINEPKFEPEKAEQGSNDDKPTPVISQEETEDAVAALLMEDTFGGTSGEFDSYTEDTPKPDTPASEPDLQIDTDAEETYDIDISKPPRTPDIPQSFYQRADTREGLEERILPLVCPSDTPVKEEAKVLEIPRTPGSNLERSKTDEASSPEIQPIKLNLDVSDKINEEEFRQSNNTLKETSDNIKHNSFEAGEKILKTLDSTEETTILPRESIKSISNINVQKSNESSFKLALRNNVSDPIKQESIIPSTPEQSQLINSFLSNVKNPPLTESNTAAEPVIKKISSAIINPVVNESEAFVETKSCTQDATSNIAAVNKSVPSTLPQVSSLKQSNTQCYDINKMNDKDLLRFNVGGIGASKSNPLSVVQNATSTTSCAMKPQHHFQQTLHPVPSSLSLVRATSIQTHPINTPTQPSVGQVHHLAVIPSQQVRTQGSPHLLQHGLTPKPVSHVIQQPPNNPVIRHAVSSSVQQVKPSAGAIVVSQPNIQRQLQLVTQSPQLSPQSLSPQNIKLIRSERPLSPINIVRLVRPVMPNQCLPINQNVPLLQNISTCEQVKPVIPPLLEVKGPPSLIAFPDKHVIQHTVSHISTPVNVIRNSPSECVKQSEPNVKEESTKPVETSTSHEIKEDITSLSSMVTDTSKDLNKVPDSKIPSTDTEIILDRVEPSSQLLETKPLKAVIHNLTSKAVAKQTDDEESEEKPNKIELVRELQLKIKNDNSSDPSPVKTEDTQESVNEIVPASEIVKEAPKDDNAKIIEKEVIGNNFILNKDDEAEFNVKEEKPDIKEIRKDVIKELKDEPELIKDIKSEEDLLTIKGLVDLEVESKRTELKFIDKNIDIGSSIDDATVEKPILVRDTVSVRGRKRKRKVRPFGPIRKAKSNTVAPVKTNTDVYEFRDDSEEERPRLILTIKSPPDRSEPPIKIKTTPTTRKSRRLQEKDGGKTPVEEVIEGVMKSSTRPGRRATRSTQPHLTVTLNPEPRKSPRRKLARPPSPIEGKPVKIESPPTPPPTPAASTTPVIPITTILTPPVSTSLTTVCTPSTPILTPPVPPTPPSSTTPPTSSTPSVTALPPTAPSTPFINTSAPSTPTPNIPTPCTPEPNTPAPVTPPPTTPASTTAPTIPALTTSISTAPISTAPISTAPISTAPISTISITTTSVPTTSTPTMSAILPPNPTVSNISSSCSTASVTPNILATISKSIISTNTTESPPSNPPTVLTTTAGSTPLTPLVSSVPQNIASKVVPKPVPTSTSLPLQSSIVIGDSTNSLLNRNALEPTTLIDPVTGLLIPMQESEEGQYIPLHSDPNRGEGEPAKKRLRTHAEVSRPSVVRQVLPPSTSTSSHATHSPACQQSPVSHHQSQLQLSICQPKVSQHQTSQLQTPVVHQPLPHLQVQVSQHQMTQSQHQVVQLPPQPHVSQHQSCQPTPPSTQLQTLATVTPVHISHPPPPLMPVSTLHLPAANHIQSSVQIHDISKPSPVSKPTSLATVTVSTPKIVITKTDSVGIKPMHQPVSKESSISHTSVVHSVPVSGGIHIGNMPSVVHSSAGMVQGVHGTVLQGSMPLVGGVMAQRHAVRPPPAHSPALNPAPAHSPALHPTPAHSPVHPTPAHHPLVVRSVTHGLNPPAAHMHHAHAVHTPAAHAVHTPSSHIPSAHSASHADSLRAVPSPAPGAPPGLPVACKPAPINPKAHLLQAVRPRPSPSPAHVPPKAHIHQSITNIRDGSLASTAGPLGASISSPPPRAAHQQPPAHLPNPPPSSPRGDVVQHYVAHMQPAHYVHSQLMYQQWMGSNNSSNARGQPQKDGANSPPLELRRPTPPRPAFYDTPPPAHSRPSQPRLHTPPHASQVPPQADSLLMLLQRHPVMWQGLLALKNDQAAVQMHFVFGNANVARNSLPCNRDGSTPPLRIAQRMRLEQTQIEGVSRKMQSDTEHCMLLALPCGRDHMDVLQQSNNLQSCFITYLQQKQAAGIVNIAVSGSQQPAYVIHIFPSCEFANESLARIAPDLMHRVADIAHLLIVIATV